MRIITIGREFSSGGREVGKRLADILGYEYYDREIITAIAENKGLREEYVENMLEGDILNSVPISFNHSFGVPTVMHHPHTNLLMEQRKIIEEIAKKGRDCIIVGRNADLILKDYKPFNIFVCATEEWKVKRCMERAEEGENLSKRKMIRNMRKIDKNRAFSREFISDSRWGDPEAYDLTVNTTGWNLKELCPIVAEFIKYSFEKKK